MTRRTLIAAALSLSIVAVGVSPALQAQGPPGGGGLTIPLLDTDTADVVLNVTRFVRSGDQILAVGTVTGSIVETVAGVTTVRAVTQQVQIPLLLNQTTGTCDILNLVLGPLDLDLLGLQVHLNQIVLDIVAEPGPGTLLGNLLCAVAGLLDGSGPLARLTNLLNQILNALG